MKPFSFTAVLKNPFLVCVVLVILLLICLAGCGQKTVEPMTLTNDALAAASDSYAKVYVLIQDADKAGRITPEQKPGIQRAMKAAQLGLDTADRAFIAYLDARSSTGEVDGVQAVVTILEGSQASLLEAIQLCSPGMDKAEYAKTVAIIDTGFRVSLRLLKAYLAQPATVPVQNAKPAEVSVSPTSAMVPSHLARQVLAWSPPLVSTAPARC